MVQITITAITIIGKTTAFHDLKKMNKIIAVTSADRIKKRSNSSLTFEVRKLLRYGSPPM
jgi:hypothetical protein